MVVVGRSGPKTDRRGGYAGRFNGSVLQPSFERIGPVTRRGAMARGARAAGIPRAPGHTHAKPPCLGRGPRPPVLSDVIRDNGGDASV